MHTAVLGDGRTIDVAALNRLAKDRLPQYVPVDELHFSTRDPKSHKSGFRLEQYIRADYSVPVLAREDGLVIDGRHRLCKLRDLGGKYIPVIYVTDEEVSSCLIPNREVSCPISGYDSFWVK